MMDIQIWVDYSLSGTEFTLSFEEWNEILVVFIDIILICENENCLQHLMSDVVRICLEIQI